MTKYKCGCESEGIILVNRESFDIINVERWQNKELYKNRNLCFYCWLEKNNIKSKSVCPYSKGKWVDRIHYFKLNEDKE